MRTKNVIFQFAVAFLGIAVHAQREIAVNTFRYSGPVHVQKPVMIDTRDVNDNDFSAKNLLQTFVDIQSVDQGGTILATDSDGYVTLPQDSLSDAFHLFRFNIDADRYAGARLDIMGTGFFEVFVDNKKEGINTYTAKDTADIDPVYIHLTLEPRQYPVVVKYLTVAGIRDTVRLKCLLTIKDTLTQYGISTEKRRRLTLADIIEGKRLTDASLSPSGKYFTIGFSHTAPDGKKQDFYELRAMKDNRTLCRLSSGKPFWMPVSDRLCYWRKGDVHEDLICLNPENMQENVLAGGLDVTSAIIAPGEGFMIAGKKDDAPKTSGSLKRLSEPDDRMEGFRDRYSLYKYDFNRKCMERLTFGKTNTYADDISRDGKKLLFHTSMRDLTGRPFTKSAFYMVDLENMQRIDTLVAGDRFVNDACFSPDGKHVLFSGSPEAFNGKGENISAGQIANAYDNQAFIMDLATREIRAVTRTFNPSIAGMRWAAGDGRIYFRTVDEDREQMYRYDPDTEKFEHLPLPEDVILKFSIPGRNMHALCIGQSLSNSSRLYSIDLKTLKSRLIADPLAATLSRIELGEVREFNFTSGHVVKGRYCLPPGFDPGKKYPLIVYYYGGTTPTARLFESRYPAHVYAALGYVVYTLQPSGAIGFGQEFSARHVNAWGLQTADEILEGTRRFCDAHPFVDRSKIGCIGASYGGFMTQYLLTKTDLFAAAVSHAGISNIASYWGEGYWGYSYGAIAGAGSYPWNNTRMYVEQSPLFHADKIATPLLLLHGSSDTNVPVGESIQMFNALKILGKTVEFIRVDGENHAITSHGKRLEWNRSIFAWFARWLKDEPEWWNAMYP
jgi:dipeptidyl aminopeptidase/acylaminoacyl peptidase